MVETKITGRIEIPESAVLEVREIKNIFDFKKSIEEKLGGKTSELIEFIIAGAITLGSSDIHLEPEKEKAKFRVRIDGLLQDVIFIELKTYQGLVSRIKLLSKLKLNVNNRPQDGRFSVVLNNTVIEIRTSSLPAEYGESIVMRILDPKSLISVESLGLRDDLIKTFDGQIAKPNGMLIVTGPTGSGKTTTLYAILKKLNSPDIKIITIEDPIEYHLEGISQTQVDSKKGYDFASGLRSIMRQDPDVILVGEIRDLETAKIALQAALTGHLVLSTIHTNDAAGTISRLQALGESPANIAPAINMAIGQRLVRKICKECAEMKEASPEELDNIKEVLKNISGDIKIPEIKKGLKIPKAKGCKFCNNTGYKERFGIYEFFLIDDNIEKFILTSPSISSLRDLAVKKGMALMKQDGFIKILRGLTTIEEVQRVAE
ncbi:MAG: GspE/PulE family protein [bacterium]|nr:GspE/PulE family protein [bacterium]